jgi:tripartite ATP-independent transporter DctM subunit
MPADPAATYDSAEPEEAAVTVLGIGISYGVATLAAMFSGMPIAFALGAVAVVFMAIFMPAASLDTVTQNVYEEIASITLLSIPLFILKGAAIGRSRAGQDLYTALHAWLHRVPGGLGVANVFACALFAAMAGSSPATCSAIGSAGIPEMRKRGYSGGFAAGIIAAGGTLGILLPPSITMILFAVAAEKSLGRLFLAGIGPGLLLVSLFGGYAVIRFRKEYAAASAVYARSGESSAILKLDDFTMAERFNVLPRVLPFVILLTGVMIALYGGYATPSETAGLGGLLALVLIALIYGVWRPNDLAPILKATIRESTMLMMIIGMSLLYSYVMSYLHISQSAAESIVAMQLPRWELLAAILVMVIVLGFFLPPVSIILMTAPIILPPLRAAGFDIIWFGIVMTIVMEMGLIHPPVGLNIFVIRNVAPDIPLMEVIWGTLPFVLLMMAAVVVLCFVPQISTMLPDLVMGPDGGR